MAMNADKVMKIKTTVSTLIRPSFKIIKRNFISSKVYGLDCIVKI